MSDGDLRTLEVTASELAQRLMQRAAELETPAERRDRRRLARVLAEPGGIAFVAHLIDRSARPREPRRLVTLVAPMLATRPRALGVVREALLDAWSRLAPLAPALAVPAFRAALTSEIHHYLIDGAPRALDRYLARRRLHGVRVNLNWTGEAILSHAEAEAWLTRCEAALGSTSVDAISVKVSALCPRTHPLAAENLVPRVVAALTRLYRAAGASKLVSLDMESWSDLELTLAAFRAALGEPEFHDRTHGLALQAYLPESSAVQRELTRWALARVAAGGAPIRVRLVKGANLGVERFESRLRGLAPRTWPSKAETDAHFKRMLAFALEPEHAAAVRLGVGSHNVFDVALALTLARERGTTHALTIEMLHGMAEPLLRTVAEVAPEVLVYAPASRSSELLGAVAYLVRRFDENAAPEHFLRHLLTMRVGDDEWHAEAARFHAACVAASTGESSIVHARTPVLGEHTPASGHAPFVNAPESDWTDGPTRTAAAAAVAAWPTQRPAHPERVSSGAVARTAERAAADPSGWATRSLAERRSVLLAAADELARRRFELMAAMAHETSKTLAESDPEIAEAIDYAAYYARSLDVLASDPRLSLAPRGVVAVISPWNFPLAIPLGGALAALIGGNRVLLKPSPLAETVAALGAEALWAAGVPRDALALVPCDDDAARQLVEDRALGALVFTGSTATARRLLAARPDLPIFAESGGKNGIIVTAAADRDRAIADIVRSAFSHGGQKGSAASLVVAEAEVFDDPGFRARLVDAAATLRLGRATDSATELAPLVTEPGAVLSGLLRALPRGERWALEPRKIGERHYSPGIVWDVQEGSPCHREELFGPVVCVMRARDLDEAIHLVNASGYGLTSALESLDELEWRHWLERIHAGNLYVNRPLVGAIVDRQPFGGWRRSGFGPGAKTGGPGYAAQLVRVTGTADVDTTYDASDLLHPRHTQRIAGQLNLFRHRPAESVVIRIEAGDDPLVVRLRHDAARATGARVGVSNALHEPMAALIGRLDGVPRVVRCGETAPAELLEAAARSWTWVCREPLTGTARDLAPFLLEQSISIDTQRHGWVAPGADDFLP